MAPLQTLAGADDHVTAPEGDHHGRDGGSGHGPAALGLGLGEHERGADEVDRDAGEGGAQRRREVGQRGGARLDGRSGGGQIVDAVEVPDHLLGARRAAPHLPDPDAPLPIDGEQRAIRHERPGQPDPREAEEVPLHPFPEPGVGEGGEARIVHPELEARGEIVPVRGVGAAEIGRIGAGLLPGRPALGAPGGLRGPHELERPVDAGPHLGRGPLVVVEDARLLPRGFLATAPRPVLVGNGQVAGGPDGGRGGLPERLLPRHLGKRTRDREDGRGDGCHGEQEDHGQALRVTAVGNVGLDSGIHREADGIELGGHSTHGKTALLQAHMMNDTINISNFGDDRVGRWV